MTHFERQNVTCVVAGRFGSSGENASFSLSFRQGTTAVMGGNSSLLELEEALEGMGTIGDVEVRICCCCCTTPVPFYRTIYDACNILRGGPGTLLQFEQSRHVRAEYRL